MTPDDKPPAPPGPTWLELGAREAKPRLMLIGTPRHGARVSGRIVAADGSELGWAELTTEWLVRDA